MDDLTDQYLPSTPGAPTESDTNDANSKTDTASEETKRAGVHGKRYIF